LNSYFQHTESQQMARWP